MGQTAGLPYRFCCFFLHRQEALPNEQETRSRRQPSRIMVCLQVCEP